MIMIIFGKDQYVVDSRSAQLIIEYMPDVDTVDELCALFSALGDSTRFRILTALSVSPLCVSDIVKLLKMNQTTVSHQLALLKRVGAVKRRRQGKIIFYSISNRKILDVILSATEFTKIEERA